MADYSAQIATALRLIAAKGTTLTLSRSPETVDAGGSEDDWNADFTDQTGPGELDELDTYTLTAVILPFKRMPGDDAFMDGAPIEHKLRRLLIAGSGLSITPKPGDQVAIGSDSWRVIGNAPLAPDGGDAIIHKAVIQLG